MAALLVVLVALFAASPAFADKPPKPLLFTSQLTPPEIDPPEPQASGSLTETNYTSIHPFMGLDVDVSCRRLKPGKQYLVVALVHWGDVWGGYGTYCTGGAFTADRKGRLDAQFHVERWESYVGLEDLWIENDQGNVVLETQR